MDSQALAFTLGRITLGLNFFAHGLVRLPKLHQFSTWMVGELQNTLIGNEHLVYGFAFGLVIVELIVGITLLIGWKTKASLILTSFIMMSLIFGACMQEAWPRVGVQMIYVIFIFLLTYFYQIVPYSLDHHFKK